MAVWQKNLWVLVVAVILCGSSYTMLVPFLPIFLLDLGVTGEQVKMWSGVIFAASFLVAAVLAPYWGRRDWAISVAIFPIPIRSIREYRVCFCWLKCGINCGTPD